MGGEFGQWKEWNHDESLEWHALQYPSHQEIQRWVKDLNLFYRNEPAMYELDFAMEGFEWIDFHDWEHGIISFIRKGKETDSIILVACNFTPVPRYKYRIGVPCSGFWKEVLNSDSELYGGSGHGNLGGVEATPVSVHGRDYSISITLPPLGILFFRGKA
jgi:1,4-alpha-glucan branching enzyme